MRKKRLLSLLIGLAVSFVLGCNDGRARVTILQTSDVHHHAAGYGPSADYTPTVTGDDDGAAGGYARLASKIQEIRRAQDRRGITEESIYSADAIAAAPRVKLIP